MLYLKQKKPADPKEEVLKVENLVVKDYRGVDKVKNLNLSVRRGEILGIAGVDGNGQTELIEAITGLRRVESGNITLVGKDITNLKPRKITETGLGHIPQDRHRHGLVLNFSVGENFVLQSYYHEPFSKIGVLQNREIYNYANKLIEEYDVRTQSAYEPARALSGGNQQKVIIGREIDRDPDLLIAAQPTRGLDVGAIEFIHKRLIEQRDNGKAVLLVSFELDEVMNVSDRIAVIFDGQILDIVNPKETNEQELGLLMAGHKVDKDNHQQMLDQAVKKEGEE